MLEKCPTKPKKKNLHAKAEPKNPRITYRDKIEGAKNG